MSLKKLETVLPENSIHFVEDWLQGKSVRIKVSKPRKNKLGDCRKLPRNQYQISVNGDLNKQAFFFVLTHEVAHLLVFENHKRAQPHGKEWKTQFKELLEETIDIYSDELKPIILNHAQKPKANLLSDRNIALTLFDKKDGLKLEDLNDGQHFRLGKRTFVRLKKRKIRYICQEISTKRMYAVSGLAEVDKIEN